MIAQKSATLVTSLNANDLVGNIQATRKATKSYIIVIGVRRGFVKSENHTKMAGVAGLEPAANPIKSSLKPLHPHK
jgi:hypothetical protein